MVAMMLPSLVPMLRGYRHAVVKKAGARLGWVIGVMDLLPMALVTAAITAERLAPGGHRIARVIAAVAVGAGVFLVARAVGAGSGGSTM
jgi:predicted metal-binding membrane protein